MSWDILPELALKSAVTLAVTLALLHLIRHRSAAQRAWVAHIGLFATLALPLAVTMLPRWEVAAAPVAQLAAPVQAIFNAPLDASRNAPVMEQVLPDAAAPALTEMPARVSTEVSATVTETVMALLPDTGTLLALAWGLPASLLLLVILVAVGRLFALRRRANVMMEQSWLGALAQAQMRMNFKHGTALLVSREISSPVSWGVLRPVILLNQAMVHNRGDAEAIIAHELAHVSRLDWAGLLLGRIVTALFWFNPMAWMLARQAHQLREEAADDAVLRSNVDRVDYAALLVGAARHEARGFLLAANGVAPSAGSLKRRITRVLDEHQLRAPAYLGWMSACVLGAVTVALPLAAFSATHEVDVAQDVTVAPAAPVMVKTLPVPQAAAAYDPRYDAMVFSNPAAAVAAKPVLTADAAEALRERAQERAERARERAQDRAEREREKIRDAAEQRARLFALAGNAMESAKRELAERERDRQDRARDSAQRIVNVDAQRESVTIDVPGVFSTGDAAGATIRAPGVNIQANADGAPAAGHNSGGNADVRAGANAGKPTSDDLIKMAVLGIDRRYRDDIANAGYNLSAGQLHQLRIHGMTGDWLRGLAAAGYDRLSVQQISNFAIHRVTPDFAVRAVQLASSRPTPEQLVQMRIAYGGRMPGEPADKDKNKDKTEIRLTLFV